MHKLFSSLCWIALTALAGGLLSATLARYAPGFGSDEEQLDLRRDSESLKRLRERQQQDANVVSFYAQSLGRYLHGDLGVSRSLQRPVRDLLAERFLPTAITLSTGLAGAWILGLILALLALFRADPITQGGLAVSTTFLQCVPSAAVGLFLFVLGGRGPLLGGAAVALVLCPRIASFAGGMLEQAYRSSHVMMARARGLSRTRVFLWHAIPVSLPQLLSFAGVSVSLVLSAAIPMEVILDTPGIGQLAWQAALSRDMSLLVALTIFFSLVIIVANTLSSLLVSTATPGRTT